MPTRDECVQNPRVLKSNRKMLHHILCSTAESVRASTGSRMRIKHGRYRPSRGRSFFAGRGYRQLSLQKPLRIQYIVVSTYGRADRARLLTIIACTFLWACNICPPFFQQQYSYNGFCCEEEYSFELIRYLRVTDAVRL